MGNMGIEILSPSLDYTKGQYFSWFKYLYLDKVIPRYGANSYACINSIFAGSPAVEAHKFQGATMAIASEKILPCVNAL